MGEKLWALLTQLEYITALWYRGVPGGPSVDLLLSRISTWAMKKIPVETSTITRLEKLQRSGEQNSERLASPGIIGAQLKALLSPPEQHGTMVWRGLTGALNLAPIAVTGEASQTVEVTFPSPALLVTATLRGWNFSYQPSERLCFSPTSQEQLLKPLGAIVQ